MAIDFFEKVRSGVPFMIHHSVGGSRLIASCNPYESKRGVKGVIFHDVYWTEADRPAIHFVEGELVKLDKDGVEGHYAVVKKDSEGMVASFEPITQIFNNSLRWKDWQEYLNFLRDNPNENHENAKIGADRIANELNKFEDWQAEDTAKA